MAKKAELLEQAKELGLKVTTKNTIKELEELIKNADQPQTTETKGTEAEQQDEEQTDAQFAKAGKRSAKAQQEQQDKDEKEERKEAIKAGEVEVEKKKGPAPKTRSKLERRTKRYQELNKLIDASKSYSVKQAAQAVIDSSKVNFDPSVEIHVKLNVDPKQADQNIRSTCVLPHGTGKTLRVAAFAASELHSEAKEAGADIVGEDDLLKKLDKEEIEFDILIATPDMMPKLGKYAKILGPKGLMPNPKSGTVSKNVGEAVKKAKSGQVEFRIDPSGIIHQVVGRASFGADKLTDNIEILIKSINEVRPSSVKASYIQSVFLTSSMGPSVPVEL